MSLAPRLSQILAIVFFCTTLAMAAGLLLSWRYFYQITAPDPHDEVLAALALQPSAADVSPLLVHYNLNVPGRGEIFPALSAASASDYWPLAVLTIANASERPTVQAVSAEVPGWSTPVKLTVILAAHETRQLPLNPDLLPSAFDNTEIRRAILKVQVRGPLDEINFSKSQTVYVHSAFDLFWGSKFSNAQFVARWVTPHDPAVLKLVSAARSYTARGRLPGYEQEPFSEAAREQEVREEARALFDAFRHSGVTYVSSIFTFGDFKAEAQRIRLPDETLSLQSANCIDVSVAYASAIENLGMSPVILIVPGHAFVGVRLAPQSPKILYLDLTVLPRGSFQQAMARARSWLSSTPPDKLLSVDVAAARALGIYPMATGAAMASGSQVPTQEPFAQLAPSRSKQRR